jgi:hypothetical protein
MQLQRLELVEWTRLGGLGHKGYSESIRDADGRGIRFHVCPTV